MISEDEALRIVRARAKSNGWALIEPLSIRLRKPWIGPGGTYEVVSDPRMRGANSRFSVDAISGEIIREGRITR